jgi:hypothetical protein
VPNPSELERQDDPPRPPAAGPPCPECGGKGTVDGAFPHIRRGVQTTSRRQGAACHACQGTCRAAPAGGEGEGKGA